MAYGAYGRLFEEDYQQSFDQPFPSTRSEYAPRSSLAGADEEEEFYDPQQEGRRSQPVGTGGSDLEDDLDAFGRKKKGMGKMRVNLRNFGGLTPHGPSPSWFRTSSFGAAPSQFSNIFNQ